MAKRGRKPVIRTCGGCGNDLTARQMLGHSCEGGPLPSVCAVMLTADRPELARKAVECFRLQTYPNKSLIIWDSGHFPRKCLDDKNSVVTHIWGPLAKSVGELRNDAVLCCPNSTDIICHWDDDDWSHPTRIAEQVKLLQESGADAVGYNQMPFWRDGNIGQIAGTGEAWQYTGSILGTSLCYWRKTWERVPFPALQDGEDAAWLKALHAAGMRSQGFPTTDMMVARMHDGNRGNNAYNPAEMRNHPLHWRRMPEWDAYLRSVME